MTNLITDTVETVPGNISVFDAAESAEMLKRKETARLIRRSCIVAGKWADKRLAKFKLMGWKVTDRQDRSQTIASQI